MRVLHVITSLRIGGAEKLLAEMAPAMNARGHQVEIAVLDATVTPLTERMDELDVKVHALGNKYRDIYNPLKVRSLRRLMRDFDIVHTHNTTPQFFAALGLQGLKDAPVLFTTEHNTKNRRRAWSWFGLIDRWMYSRYKAIVCVNQAVRDALANHLGGRFADRMSVIDNGIDYDAYAHAQPTDELRRLFPGKRIVVMVSAMRRQKDHQTLLRAMALLPGDYALALAGDGETRHEIESLSRELGISDRIAFLGFRTDVARLLKGADIVVQATHYEGMSLSLIEAMASGRPYIASDVEGVREVAKGAALLFAEGDSQGLADLIARVADDAQLGAEVGARCQQLAMNYQISHTLDSYLKLYQLLVPKHKN